MEKYGKDNAKYIMETLQGCAGTRNHNVMAYIDMGIADFKDHEGQARKEAQDNGWKFERLEGGMS